MIPLQALKRSARYELIRAGLECTALLGLAGIGRGSGGRGAIFTLHHVDPAPVARGAPNGWLTVTPHFLDQAIRAAIDCGLTPVALDDLPARLADPQDKARYVSFTLDDGYRDNAVHAAPVFRRHGVPYTIFVTAGFVERSRSIWWKTVEEIVATAEEIDFAFADGQRRIETKTQLQKIAAFDRLSAFVLDAEDEDAAIAAVDALAMRHGIDPLGITERETMGIEDLRTLARDPLARFGAHTLTHANLRRLDAARLERELSGSADAVERYTGRRPTSFAYPYGHRAAVGGREIAAARDAGFAAAVTTMPSLIGSTAPEHPTALGRVSLNGLYQRRRYVRALLSGLPFELRRLARGGPSRDGMDCQ
ncbi:polysaccharide deacetylase family protein [Nitratireductor sp. ZSWI3]|uniref:polysaccharide deacetylase family protein n=1 Tax=Nitratireductor sp. ZSWI3 TaxID=2966359 RepID=UPI00214FC377|nr:polysaccharide deacetylase family protein [Nitratireductor sp. ZSWI3]MCR4269187.1 polysaccharide deacetylase family protein [Nitratireductor sp. ZSWI3]